MFPVPVSRITEDATPMAQYLDGVEVTKSERIKSAQEFAEVEASIHQQEAQALAQREVQRQEALRKHEEEEAAAQDLKEVELEEEGKMSVVFFVCCVFVVCVCACLLVCCVCLFFLLCVFVSVYFLFLCMCLIFFLFV